MLKENIPTPRMEQDVDQAWKKYPKGFVAFVEKEGDGAGAEQLFQRAGTCFRPDVEPAAAHEETVGDNRMEMRMVTNLQLSRSLVFQRLGATVYYIFSGFTNA